MPNGSYLYNITEENITSIPQLTTYIEQYVFPIGEVIVMLIAFVSFVSFVTKWGVERAFAGMSFISFISALMLWLVGVLADLWVYAFAVMLALSVVILFVRNN